MIPTWLVWCAIALVFFGVFLCYLDWSKRHGKETDDEWLDNQW